MPSGATQNGDDAAVLHQLAQLEGAEASLVLASGMAAMACTMVTLLRPGDHMVASRWLRPDTRRFFEQELPALGVSVSFVDPTETRGWRRSLTRTTRLFFVESPVDPSTRVVDLRPPRTLAMELGVALVVDSTFASPVNFRAMACGADVVLHSSSAFLDGAQDGYAGVVCGTEGVIDEVRTKMRSWGAEPHPAAVASLARGLKTLTVRVQRQNATALAVATWASQQPSITSVMYPGLASHPDHAIAAEFFTGFGSLLTITPAGGAQSVAGVLSRLQRFRACADGDAARLGGMESVASAAPASTAVPEGSIRLNIGLDDASTLIGDLTQALE